MNNIVILALILIVVSIIKIGVYFNDGVLNEKIY